MPHAWRQNEQSSVHQQGLGVSRILADRLSPQNRKSQPAGQPGAVGCSARALACTARAISRASRAWLLLLWRGWPLTSARGDLPVTRTPAAPVLAGPPAVVLAQRADGVVVAIDVLHRPLQPRPQTSNAPPQADGAAHRHLAAKGIPLAVDFLAEGVAEAKPGQQLAQAKQAEAHACKGAEGRQLQGTAWQPRGGPHERWGKRRQRGNSLHCTSRQGVATAQPCSPTRPPMYESKM